MSRYADKHSAGPSRIAEFRPGEDPKRRHARRLREAGKHAGVLEEFCTANGIALGVYNNQHHWQMRWGGRQIDWWPSTAKLVIDKAWSDGVHTHDPTQVLDILKREFERKEATVGEAAEALVGGDQDDRGEWTDDVLRRVRARSPRRDRAPDPRKPTGQTAHGFILAQIDAAPNQAMLLSDILPPPWVQRSQFDDIIRGMRRLSKIVVRGETVVRAPQRTKP